MRLIGTADWHIRASNPQFRIDDYPMSTMNKVAYIVDIANRYKAGICVAGDIFDNVKVGYKYTNMLISILRKAKYGVYTVPGQHDQEHHGKDMLPTPYQTLIESGVIIDVNGKCVDGIVGIGWEGKLPNKCEYDNPDVIIMHYCVTEGDPPFFLEQEASSSRDLLKKYSQYSHLVCGDYHTPHITVHSSQLCINCGSIGRSSKDQYSHRPRVVLFDTKKPGKFKIIYLPIKPSKEVFNIPKETVIDDSFADQIKELAKELADRSERPNYVNTVKFLLKKSGGNKRHSQIAQKYLRIGRTSNGR